jgi:uncharacterized protein YyaL (SSP411 family)
MATTNAPSAHRTGGNRLRGETSPYLLQHAHNPVDWFPWGSEALGLARSTDRPILLSIGYSACHWCHVMERESFEDPATAALMNELFVNVKVDREERPDLDGIYMQAVQALTGQGGWPMTVFLLPDGTPFYGGTYYPPERRHGLPAFRDVLRRVSEAYRGQKADVLEGARQLRDAIAPAALAPSGDGALTRDTLRLSLEAFRTTFDRRHGGFGQGQKFPQAPNLDALLRIWRATGDVDALAMVTQTLDAMANGGIWDHLGGGFHRYTVDRIWLVPHFEKMLYDNAQLARTYLAAWQATGKARYAEVVRDILAYVLREMTAPNGTFHAAQDADSEGEEGKFFAWSVDEIVAALGPDDARVATACYGVSQAGNFEGKNVLYRPRSHEDVAAQLGIETDAIDAAISRIRPALLAVRSTRVAPGRDDKVIASWNGMMVRAFAEAGAVLGDEAYLAVGARAANALFTNLRANGDVADPSGSLRLWRIASMGRTHVDAFLEDYAALGLGALALSEATGQGRWFRAARACAGAILARFRDREHGGFFDTGDDHETLVARPKDLYDNAVPSGSSMACELLLRLEALGVEGEGGAVARDLLARLATPMTKHPGAFGTLIGALDLATAKPVQVALIGTVDDPDASTLQGAVYATFAPNLVVAIRRGDGADDGEVPVLEARVAVDSRPTAYVCEAFTCLLPTTDPAEVARQIARAVAPVG